MLQLEGSVENHRIFSRYSLVDLLYFLYIILLSFTLYFVSFLFHYFVYIEVSLYYVIYPFNKEKYSILLSFHNFIWSVLDFSIHGERIVGQLTWIFCGEEKTKGVANCKYFLDIMKGEES